MAARTVLVALAFLPAPAPAVALAHEPGPPPARRPPLAAAQQSPPAGTEQPPLAAARQSPPATHQPPGASGRLAAPRLVARGVAVPLRGAGVAPGARVRIERRRRGVWRRAGAARADRRGRWRLRLRQRPAAHRLRLRAVVGAGAPTPAVLVRTRTVSLAAVGDVNLGDGPAAAMAARGYRYPWTGVARALRGSDVALANLECAISRRGRPQPKEFTFRGRPAALRTAARYAGIDVVSLANNHAGDYGPVALLDTLAFARRYGITAVGAGRNAAAAFRPRVVRRLGLRIAFVGISDVVPPGFPAGPGRPGTTFPSPPLIRAAVRRAARRAHVVVAAFHWGAERSHRPSGRQRGLAGVALRAGADVVVGSHPHVLQPIERRGRRLVAYSLGNFVFGARSPATSSTGILALRLSARGVERVRFRRARIHGVRPVLTAR